MSFWKDLLASIVEGFKQTAKEIKENPSTLTVMLWAKTAVDDGIGEAEAQITKFVRSAPAEGIQAVDATFQTMIANFQRERHFDRAALYGHLYAHFKSMVQKR